VVASARQQRECGDKLRFCTREDARIHAMIAKFYWNDDLNSYHCRWCGYYHVGHKKVPDILRRG